MNKLIESLETIRKAEGLTQVQFGKKIGVSRSMMEAMIQGKRRPGAKVLRAIVKQYPGLNKQVTDYLTHSSDGVTQK